MDSKTSIIHHGRVGSSNHLCFKTPECPSNKRAFFMGERIRGRRWMEIRRVVLAQSPWCEHCLQQGKYTRSTEVDHIQRLADGGINHPDNYQALCNPCHASKTAVENGKQRVAIGADGYAL